MFESSDSTLFKSMFDHATVGIIMANRNGEIIQVNTFANDMFGYTPGELINKKIEVLIPRSIRTKHVGYRKGYDGNPRTRPMGIGQDLAGLHKSGRTFPVEVSLSFAEEGEERVVIAFINDTSIREEMLSFLRQSEKELQEYSDRLEQKVIERTHRIAENEAKLIEAQKMARLGYWEFDLVSNKIVTSDVLLDILDIKEQHVTKELLLDCIYDEDRDSALSLVRQVITDGHRREYSYRIMMGNGQLKHIQGYLEKEEGTAKRNAKIFGITQDVTTQKKSELQLAQSLARERELGELKSRFVSMASHEFRTPLTSIMSSADIIGIHAERLGVDKFDRHLSRIKAQVDNLTSILNDFLSLDKLESGTIEFLPTQTNIADLIHLVVEETVSVRKERERVVINHEGNDTANVDAKLLRNVLVNLLSNAIKYTPTGGEIKMNSYCGADHLRIDVVDQGIGIPIRDQQTIYQRFFRASNAESIKGTGLGLNIVKKYLEIMNGTISFVSQENKGTTFTVHIKC